PCLRPVVGALVVVAEGEPPLLLQTQDRRELRDLPQHLLEPPLERDVRAGAVALQPAEVWLGAPHEPWEDPRRRRGGTAEIAVDDPGLHPWQGAPLNRLQHGHETAALVALAGVVNL